MREFQSLKVLDLFQGIFRGLGIDYVKMRRIVQLKLTMDGRRVPTVFSQTKLKEGNQFVKSLGIYALYGLVLIALLFFPGGAMLQMSIIFGIMMFILMSSLIADFSAVLLDVRDRSILNTKPVGDRTINAAKLVHIGIYLSLLTGAFVGIPAIVMLVKNGIGFLLIFLVLVLFLLMFIIALTALVYMLILRFFDGERLKDIVNYVQIILAVGIFVGYQVFARSFEFVDLAIVYEFHWWHVFVPPFWFGAPFALILNGETGLPYILLSLLALAVPLASIFIYGKLMPVFEQNLQKLMGSAKGLRQKRAYLREFWVRLLCRGREERVFFRFAWQMMGQEREFKLKVYPSLGIGLVMPFIFIFNLGADEGIAQMRESNSHLFIYLSLIIAGSVIMMLSYSDKYRGRWIYHVAPVKHFAGMHKAAVKAGLAKLFLPLYIVESAVFIWIFGARIIPDLFIVLLVGIVYSVISYALGNDKAEPFSEPIGQALQSGSAKQLIFMLIPAAFAVVHVIAKQWTYGIPAYLVIMLVLTGLIWTQVFHEKEWA